MHILKKKLKKKQQIIIITNILIYTTYSRALAHGDPRCEWDERGEGGGKGKEGEWEERKQTFEILNLF